MTKNTRFSKANIVRCMMQQSLPYKVTLDSNFQIIKASSFFNPAEDLTKTTIHLPEYSGRAIIPVNWRVGDERNGILAEDLLLFSSKGAPWINDSILKDYIYMLELMSENPPKGLFFLDSDPITRSLLRQAILKACKKYKIIQSRNINIFNLPDKKHIIFVKMRKHLFKGFREDIKLFEVALKLKS